MYCKPFTRFSVLMIFLAMMSMVLTWISARNPSSVQAAPLPKQINADKLSVGEVVMTGIQENEGCKIEPFQINTTIPGNGDTQWVGVVINSKCQVVVKARWKGALEHGPSEVVQPLLKLLASESQSVPETTESMSMAPSLESTSLLATTCKTSYQNVYMYGLGGSADRLTTKSGTLNYCYNGSSVWISSQNGGCSGSTLPTWRWVVDRCRTISTNSGPTTSKVYRNGDGNYHCSPTNVFPCNIPSTDGYYHTLGDGESAYPNGTSNCSYGYGGTIVAGVNQQILQGCR
jgi:hypothetical protein